MNYRPFGSTHRSIGEAVEYGFYDGLIISAIIIIVTIFAIKILV